MILKQTVTTIAAALLLHSFVYAADTYKIDSSHTSISFSVRHLNINNVKGQFKEFAGTIVLDDGKIASAKGTIQVSSVDTGVKERDDHLRTADFFDAARYPTITFQTKRIEISGRGEILLIAYFTMRGVTKELALPAKLAGPTKDQWGNMRIGLEAKTKLNRKDYGINYREVLETGALAVGEEIELEINAEAIKDSGNKNSPEK